MESGLFSYILRYSKREQVVLTIMTIAALPFYYLSLDLPKTIINDAISGTVFPVDMVFEFAGFTVDFGALPQIPYLTILCFAFLFLVLINSGFKLFINIYRGVMGERMLRRMRLELIDRIMRFPLARFRKTSQGELVSMVNQETEPLGGFIGESFSLPLYQGGLLLTILVFMFAQDWKLGLAAIALYPIQAWVIPKLQRQVNLLNRERIFLMRRLAEDLGEIVAGINEIHINDNRTFFKDSFSKILGETFYIRVEIYKKKFFIKFLNNSIAQLTPFLFFLIGGYLVIKGELSIGALVAVLAAYKDLSPPWKELLTWYQRQADSRIRYLTLTEQFEIDEGMPLSADAQAANWSAADTQDLPIVASNISLKRHDGVHEVDNLSLSVNSGNWISLVGTGSSGKHGLAQMFARLVNPTSGKLLYAELDVTKIPKMLTGRSISYVGHDSYLFATSIRDNLLLSLKHSAQENNGLVELDLPDALQNKNWLVEAQLSGNSEVDVSADWIDLESAGASDAGQLPERIRAVLRTVDLEDDLVRYALEHNINPTDYPDLAEKILQARALFKERVIAQELESIVEFLDPDKYNDNASLAENILFGVSNHEMFSAAGLAEHPVLRELLHEYDLAESLDTAAISIAKTTVELFSDLPPGHEFFERYRFVDSEDLFELQRILGAVKKLNSIDELATLDRTLLRSLPFRVISGRHRMGVFDADDKIKFLELRKAFHKKLDNDSRSQIDVFAPASFNALTPIGENIIFGRVVFGRLGASSKVYKLILEVLQSLDLMSPILEIGLAAPSGLAGGLLPKTQQQKLVLARALIKRPRVLVINEGLSALDTAETETILSTLKEQYPQLILFWVDSQSRYTEYFDRVVHLEAGKMTKLEEPNVNVDSNGSNESEKTDAAVRSAHSVEDGEKVTLLKDIPLFRFLDDPHLLLLANNCDALNVPKGDRLFNQGEPGEALYIIVDGTVSILISDGVTENQVRICGVNELIGELALLSNEPRAASVEAITDLTVLRLKREVFIDILRTNGDIGYQVLQDVANRFTDSSRKLATLAQS